MNDLAHDIRRYIDGAAPPVTLDEVRARHHPHRRPTPTAVAAVLVVLVVLAGAGFLVARGPRSSTVPGPVTSTLTPAHHLVGPIDRARLAAPEAMAMEKDGSLLIANQGTNQILRRQPDGHLTVLAGDGKKGFSGDGGPAVDAEL